MIPVKFRNTILQHLSTDCIERLHLHPVNLTLRQNLQVPGETIEKIYFVESGIGSMTTVFSGGKQVEVGMFGYESVVGVSALMGVKRGLNHIFMQLGGNGFSCNLARAQTEFSRGELFQNLALRYVQAQLTASTQSAACNATHSLSQRLARWLLICADRAGESKIALSQDFLAEMLGSRRTSVTVVAARFRQRGLIDYRRGKH